MINTTVMPANQKHRINTLRVALLVLLPLVLFTRPGLPLNTVLMDVIESTGMLLVISGVLGRFWCILYIGGRKNAEVMRDGPYSICRHPLYLFSTLSVFGFGLVLESLFATVILTSVVFYVLNDIAGKEETFLRAEFGRSYDDYEACTPRIFPKFSNFSSPPTVTFDTATLRRNFFDALVFLSLIPIGEMTEHFKDAGSLPTFPLF